jgi:hypothetical protein
MFAGTFNFEMHHQKIHASKILLVCARKYMHPVLPGPCPDARGPKQNGPTTWRVDFTSTHPKFTCFLQAGLILPEKSSSGPLFK